MSGWIASATSWVSSVLRFCGGLCQHRAPAPPALTSASGGSTPDSESEFSVVTGGAASTAAAAGPRPVFEQTVSQPFPELELTEAEVSAILAASTAAELHRLFPESLADYRERVLGEVGTPGYVWTLEARATRALRAGLSARRVLQGRGRFPVKSPRISAESSIYVVLRSNGDPSSWWCRNFILYKSLLAGPRGFQPGSLSHSFATEAEAELYLIGAGRGWPVQLLQLL